MIHFIQLFGPSNMSLGCYVIAVWESKGEGIQWSNLGEQLGCSVAFLWTESETRNRIRNRSLKRFLRNTNFAFARFEDDKCFYLFYCQHNTLSYTHKVYGFRDPGFQIITPSILHNRYCVSNCNMNQIVT